MDDHIFDAGLWGFYQLGIKDYLAICRATSPAGRHFLDQEAVGLNAIFFKSLYPGFGYFRKLRFCTMPVPGYQDGFGRTSWLMDDHNFPSGKLDFVLLANGDPETILAAQIQM